MQPDRKNWHPRWSRMATALALAALAAAVLLSACADPATSISKGNTPQQQRAMAMWQERCKKSGEFIHKTVENVEGIYLVNVRTEVNRNQGEQPADQFRLSDPYGHDLTGDGYLITFLRDSYHYDRKTPWPPEFPPHKGYRFVEANDPKEGGKLYRFTGRVEEPWQFDQSYLKGYVRFALDRKSITRPAARYGVKFEDISTPEERENWIAGSSLKVIDLQSQEVIAERIGYMVDWAQGSRAGGRQPWTFAADHACPDFDRDFPQPVNDPSHKFRSQARQTQRFVEKVLKPLL